MNSPEDLRDQFREFDADDDGRIDFGEFKKLLTRVGLRRPEPVMRRVFETMDENHDGTISFREFSTWWTQVAD